MNGDVLADVLCEGRRSATFETRSVQKLNGIRNDLLGSAPGMVYMESSHMMGKTFLDVVVESLGRLGRSPVVIIVLRRNPMATMISQAQLGWFTEGHSGWNNWYFALRDLHESERLIEDQTPVNLSHE